jgi:hypothetical protein
MTLGEPVQTLVDVHSTNSISTRRGAGSQSLRPLLKRPLLIGVRTCRNPLTPHTA